MLLAATRKEYLLILGYFFSQCMRYKINARVQAASAHSLPIPQPTGSARKSEISAGSINNWPRAINRRLLAQTSSAATYGRRMLRLNYTVQIYRNLRLLLH